MSNALEKFVLLAKGARGAACKAVIEQVLSSNDVFVFGELLDLTTVKELKESPDRSIYDLLELFAYGVYEDYLSAASNLPPLSPTQQTKLQTLTFVSMAGNSKTVPYSALLKALHLTEVRQLEDLIIDAIYKGLVGGKLDQVQQNFQVDFAIGRDVRASDLAVMAGALDRWCSNCEGVLQLLTDEMDKANATKIASKKQQDAMQTEVERVRKEVLAALHSSQAALEHIGMEFDESRLSAPKSKRMQRSMMRT